MSRMRGLLRRRRFMIAENRGGGRVNSWLALGVLSWGDCGRAEQLGDNCSTLSPETIETIVLLWCAKQLRQLFYFGVRNN